MRSGGGNNRRQMWRKFFRGGPLVESRVRSAPHRDFAVAERLLRQPLDNIVSVARFICERLEFAAGIPAASNIDQSKSITMRGEVGSTRVIGVGNVRSKGENHRFF